MSALFAGFGRLFRPNRRSHMKNDSLILSLTQSLSLLGIALGLSACGPTNESSQSSGGGGTVGGTGKVLKFSAIPNQNATELKAKFDPMAAHLADELGVPVEFVPSADYKASVEMFKNGQIQLAWFGGVTGVQAHHAVAGARAIVSEMRKYDERLYRKPRWLVLNKIDVVAPDERARVAAEFRRRLRTKAPLFAISAATGEGCAELVAAIARFLPSVSGQAAPGGEPRAPGERAVAGGRG